MRERLTCCSRKASGEMTEGQGGAPPTISSVKSVQAEGTALTKAQRKELSMFEELRKEPCVWSRVSEGE